MKTVILLLIIIGFCVQSKAQVITNDKNWSTTPVFNDNFNPPRSNWDSNWFDYPNNYLWRSHLIEGVTHGEGYEHQVYQRNNSIFNSSDSTIRLRAEYVGGPLNCNDYEIPPNGYSCDTSLHTLYYYSGAITTLLKYKYGYFESRLKMPVERGAFPAFWLYNQSDGNYREIDIFEHSYGMMYYYDSPDSTRIFNNGIFYYNNVANLDTHYGDYGHTLLPSEPNLSNWHTYSIEWSPKRVLWYFDNKLINEFYGDSIPSDSMFVILNYALDNWVIDGVPLQYNYPNDMTIDYVRIYKLKCDCSTDAIIQNNSQLSAYDYKVKKTVTAGGYGNAITITSNSKVVFRATDSITINGDFEVQSGSELELITHSCPE